MCCDCCLLGKAAQELGLPCDHTLSVGYQCGQVSQTCCVGGTPDNQTTPTELTECGWKKHIMLNKNLICILFASQRENCFTDNVENRGNYGEIFSWNIKICDRRRNKGEGQALLVLSCAHTSPCWIYVVIAIWSTQLCNWIYFWCCFPKIEIQGDSIWDINV